MTDGDIMILKEGRIPTHVIRPHMVEFLERYETFGWNEEYGEDEEPNGNLPLKTIPPLGARGIFAERVGCSLRQLRRIEIGEVSGISFDLADNILIQVGRVDLWRGELQDYYYNVDLSKVDQSLPCMDEAVAA